MNIPANAQESGRDVEVNISLRSDLSPLVPAEIHNKQWLASDWEMQDSGNADGAVSGPWTFAD